MPTYWPCSCLLPDLPLEFCVCDCDDLALTSVRLLNPKVYVYWRSFQVSLVHLRVLFFSSCSLLCFSFAFNHEGMLYLIKCFFLNIMKWACDFFIFSANLCYTSLDLSMHWPLMKVDPIQGHYVFYLCIVWEEGGKIILCSSFSSFWCPLCLSLFMSFWHEQLNSGLENLWPFFAQLGLTNHSLLGSHW